MRSTWRIYGPHWKMLYRRYRRRTILACPLSSCTAMRTIWCSTSMAIVCTTDWATSSRSIWSRRCGRRCSSACTAIFCRNWMKPGPIIRPQWSWYATYSCTWIESMCSNAAWIMSIIWVLIYSGIRYVVVVLENYKFDLKLTNSQFNLTAQSLVSFSLIHLFS